MTPTTLRELNDDLAAANGRLVLRVRELEEALRPFAEAAQMFDPSPETFEVEGVGKFHANDYWVDRTMLRGFYGEGDAEEYTDDWLCSVGDIRRARAALDRKP